MDKSLYIQIADGLLNRHFGIPLSATALSEPDLLHLVIQRGREPFEAVNALAQEYDLMRTDIRHILGAVRYASLTAADQEAVLANLAVMAAGTPSRQKRPVSSVYH